MRQELELERRALKNGWNLSTADRERVKRTALAALDSPSMRDRIAGCRVLALIDSIDAKRERTQAWERDGEIKAATGALRAALTRAEIKEALAALTAGQPPPAPQAAEGPSAEQVAAESPTPQTTTSKDTAG